MNSVERTIKRFLVKRYGSWWSPDETAFVDCPACGKLNKYGRTQCKTCLEELSEDYAEISALVNVINVRAVNNGKSIVSLEPIIVLFAAASVDGYFLNWAPMLLAGILFSLLLVGIGLEWLIRYRRFPLGDAEFHEVKKAVLRSIALFASSAVAHILVFIFMFPTAAWINI